MYIERKWPSRHWLAVGMVQEKLLLWGMRVCGSCDGMQPAKRAGRAREKGENESLFQLCRAETLFYVNVWDLLGTRPSMSHHLFWPTAGAQSFMKAVWKFPRIVGSNSPVRPTFQFQMPCIIYTQRLHLSTVWIVAIHPYCKINALTLATSRKWLRCHWRLQQRDCRALNVTQVWHFWFWSRLFLLSFVACLLASVERALRKLQAQVVDVPCKLSDCQTLDILKFKLNIPLDPSVSCPNISLRRSTNSAPG